ncbi:RNA-binding domain-containing protein [Mycena indigotica]|uniref:RNA-binding domain-containing protein n=1 Tax=Mycena indigotica TaxID=2126181 RepID=A0A8H6T702_9AGAR|nr:RNA-binding domain-containing protein [Mycena indigotica]KAF7312233.1 RNA-binding domain-containing protein [Mycena indigotica]
MTSESSTTKKAKRKAVVEAVVDTEPQPVKRKKTTEDMEDAPRKKSKKEKTLAVPPEEKTPKKRKSSDVTVLPDQPSIDDEPKPSKKSKKAKGEADPEVATAVEKKDKKTKQPVVEETHEEVAPKPTRKQKREAKAAAKAEAPDVPPTIPSDVEPAPKSDKKKKKRPSGVESVGEQPSANEKVTEIETVASTSEETKVGKKRKVKPVETKPVVDVDSPQPTGTPIDSPPKPSKKAKTTVAPEAPLENSVDVTPKVKKSKEAVPIPKEPSPPPPDSEEEDDDAIHGFMTDDEDSSDEDDGYMDVEVSAADISKLPTIAKDDKTVQKKLENAKRKPAADRGVIFLGRIPHGFYEEQAKAYFSQFGNVTRLRVSRNKKTGQSKHYGFIEFDSSSVAQIVADTMDNYLLMGHILRCKLIPKDQVHPELWVGANRKWRPVPKARVARAEHNKPRTKEQQLRATDRLLKRQEERHKKLLKLGIKYDATVAGYKPQA